MAPVVTSFVPTGGPTTGGTRVVITGTGLSTATAVMFGDTEGSIDTTATNTATSLTVISPAVPNDSTLARKLTVLDSAAGTEGQSSGNYTYTVVNDPVLTSTGAGKWKLEIDSSVAQDGSAFIAVKGITDFKPTLATTTQDDSDYDSGVWGSDAKTQLKWSLAFKVSRKRAAGYAEDPGQKLLRLAHDQIGTGGSVLVRWYDRNGHGSEAFKGTGMVEWDDDGGPTTALSTTSVTVMGQGPRTAITNPAGA